MNPLIKNLYTEDELQEKIQKCEKKHRDSETRECHQGMINATYALALIYEILEDNKKSRDYLEKVVREWDAYPDKVAESRYVNALMKLGRSKKALDEIIKNPGHWGIETLAYAYREAGRKHESILLYSGLAMHAFELSETYSSPWRPHYLQKASNLWERAENQQLVYLYNQRALEAWNEVENNTDRDLYTIEEAWLYEEVGYIQEEARRLEPALEYYEKARAKYEKSYIEEAGSAETNYSDGDGSRYHGFFSLQIPDLPCIHLPLDTYEEKDLRRIRYRILNLEQKMKSRISI